MSKNIPHTTNEMRRKTIADVNGGVSWGSARRRVHGMSHHSAHRHHHKSNALYLLFAYTNATTKGWPESTGHLPPGGSTLHTHPRCLRPRPRPHAGVQRLHRRVFSRMSIYGSVRSKGLSPRTRLMGLARLT